MTSLATVARYWETLRRLRPVQVYGRAWFRLARVRIERAQSPGRRIDNGAWRAPARCRSSLTGPQSFTFLNESGDIEACGWDGDARDKLWRYNQHYFEDLTAFDAAERAPWHRALLQDWINQNPPGGGVGWEPYPTSLRIVNWIKWALAGNDLDEGLLASLATQARWLSRRIEWHLLGNHLFANAKALIFAGLFLDGAEADGWRNKGFSILARETDEQVLSDGGQFELSPMYHALALADVLDLINISESYSTAITFNQRLLVSRWRTLSSTMARWLEAMSHPDGDLSFFNDAAFGVAPSRNELTAYAARLQIEPPEMLTPLTLLAESGYARLSRADAVLIADVAKVGPDYLPGHAHADTLSCELSVFGSRLFVNSGTSVYGTGLERLRQRGTAAHNTVSVAGVNSSDVWSGFRVGARARPHGVHVASDAETLILEGAHDGYCRLPGGPIHTRRWALSARSLRISDQLSVQTCPAEARFHLHPDVCVTQATPQSGDFVLKGGGIVNWRVEAGSTYVEAATWHPEFGIAEPTSCLVAALVQGRSVLELTWK